MTISIRALDRGGFSAHGGAYDARNREIVFCAMQDEARAVTLAFPENISTVTKEENGVTASTPSISGDTASFTVSDATNGGYVDLIVTLMAGDVRRVRLTNAAGRALYDYGRF